MTSPEMTLAYALDDVARDIRARCVHAVLRFGAIVHPHKHPAIYTKPECVRERRRLSLAMSFNGSAISARIEPPLSSRKGLRQHRAHQHPRMRWSKHGEPTTQQGRHQSHHSELAIGMGPAFASTDRAATSLPLVVFPATGYPP